MSNEGKRVKVHYTGTLKDGTKFDSSLDRDQPLQFICMEGQMIPGFDKAVAEMAVGEKKTVVLPAAEAYGEYRDDLIMQVPLQNMPQADQIIAGEMIQLSGPGGQPILAQVRERNNDVAVLDLNHELAGQDLTFEIELLSVD